MSDSTPQPKIDEQHSLRIILRDFDPDAIDIDALSCGVAHAAAHVPDMDLVDIVVSGDFERYVRETEGAGERSNEYRQERLLGGARAMILPRASGRVELLIDAEVVGVDRDADHDPVRVFIHEALHIAIAQRGETLNGRRARLGHALGTADGMIDGLAGIAGEEFRVQRALAQLGHPLEQVYRTELTTLIEAYRASLRAPFAKWDETGDVQDLAEAVLPGFEYLMTVVAYVIADDVASDGQRVPDLAALGASRWLADSYASLRTALEPVPAATETTPLDSLDALCEPVADAIDAWLADIGFAIHDVPDGLYLEILDADDLERDLITTR